MENLKNVVNYEGLYIVSDTGKIFSIKYNREIKSFTDKSYQRVALSSKAQRKNFLVHRLVALAFIPNPEKKLFVNHIDGNTLNNNLSNLEWCTSSENEYHSYNVLGKICWAKGRKGKEHGASKRIKAINIDLGIIKYYDSRNLASEDLSIDATCISRVANGQTKSSKGYYFEYV